jgi:alkanesulfonate monooxygenase SsuD/methylene tetrahydromethanopterin reductase-like flavin-dependent oxidoreductase (luciferase family)
MGFGLGRFGGDTLDDSHHHHESGEYLSDYDHGAKAEKRPNQKTTIIAVYGAANAGAAVAAAIVLGVFSWRPPSPKNINKAPL